MIETLAATQPWETQMPDDDFNQRNIEEFRANGGKVGGPFEGAPLLLPHTTGARSRQERVNPVMYRMDRDRLVIFAPKAGAPSNPDWFHNLVANPCASVEVGTKTFEVDAHVAEDGERERLWSDQKQDFEGFADYEANTTRGISVVVLERFN